MTIPLLLIVLCMLCGAAGYFFAHVGIDSGLLKYQPAILFWLTCGLIVAMLCLIWACI